MQHFGDLILTFLVAMVPVIELRGAIPFGVARGVGLWYAIIASILGNLLPAPFIILFIRKIFAWMRTRLPKLNGLVSRLEERARGKMDKIQHYAFWGLVLLVAIPLPGTGAWTGSLVAAMMDMRLKKALPAICLGVFIAAVVVSVITYGVTVVF